MTRSSIPRLLLLPTATLALATIVACGDDKPKKAPSRDTPAADRSKGGGRPGGGSSRPANPAGSSGQGAKEGAGSIEGNWHGQIVTPDSDTVFATFRLVREGQGWRGSVNVPILQKNPAPPKQVTFLKDTLAFEAQLGDVSLRMNGKLQNEGKSFRGRVSTREPGSEKSRRGSMEFRRVGDSEPMPTPTAYSGTVTMPDGSTAPFLLVSASVPSGASVHYAVCEKLAAEPFALNETSRKGSSVTLVREAEEGTSTLLLEVTDAGAVTGTMRRTGDEMRLSLERDDQYFARKKTKPKKPATEDGG